MDTIFLEIKEDDWVEVMKPNTTRLHRLLFVDAKYAHSYCGKIFDVSDLSCDQSTIKRCERCEKYALKLNAF